MSCLPKQRAARGALVAGTLVVSACASVPRNAGFDDVQRLVTTRDPALRGQLLWQANPDTAVAHRHMSAGAIDTLLAHPLTPASTVGLALVRNPGIQVTYARLGVARADILSAGLGPQLFVDVAALRANAAKGALNAASNVLELNVTGAIFSAFQIPRRRRIADAAFTATKLEVAQSVLNVVARTRATYYAVVAAEQMAELDSTIAFSTALGADFAQRQHTAGNITDLDLAAEQALAAQARLDALTAQQERLDAREDLGMLLGISGSDTSGRATWHTMVRLPDPPAQEPTRTDIEQAALTQRLDLAAARADLTARGAALGVTGMPGLVPAISVGVRYDRDAEGTHALGPTLALPLPLFDRGQGTRARAIAELNGSRAQYVALALDAQSQVRRAYAALRSARERAITLRDVVLPLRQRVLEQSQLEYNGMLIGVYQLLQAKRDQITAGRSYVTALRDYWTARATLDAALGGALDSGTTDAMFVAAQPPSTPRDTLSQDAAAHDSTQASTHASPSDSSHGTPTR
jgi:cobalt-zinc-cadmium efflux system outer membrane protein